MCFRYVYKGCKKQTYQDLGALVAITLVNGGYGLPIFCPHVAELIVFGEKRSSPSTQFIPDEEIRTAVEKVQMFIVLLDLTVSYTFISVDVALFIYQVTGSGLNSQPCFFKGWYW